MTRIGKIARLPKEIREQLNRRLQDGEPGKDLVQWLNELPAVKKVLAKHFGSRPINEQNLSEWKQGGYQEELRHEESRERIRWLVEQANDLDDAADGLEISDRLGSVLAAELANQAEILLREITDPKERWNRFQEVLRELWRLRHEDHHGKRLQMQRERWDREMESQDEANLEQQIQKAKKRAAAPIWAQMMKGTLAQTLGGGEVAEKTADFLTKLVYDLPPFNLTPPYDLYGGPGQNQIKVNQTESNPIQPNEKMPAA